jgi:hypothetical protein
MLYSTTVFAAGVQDKSYNKFIPFGNAIKDYVTGFSSYFDIALIGSESSLGNSSFLKIYREDKEKGLVPIQIRIKKVGETPVIGDLLDWYQYGKNITKFQIFPIEESMPDDFYNFYFQCDVTLVSFDYISSKGGKMYVVNENSTIKDFYLNDVDQKQMLDNKLTETINRMKDAGAVQEEQRNLTKDTNKELVSLNSKLSHLMDDMDKQLVKMDTTNQTLSDIKFYTDTINYRVGFIVYLICFVIFIYFSYFIFRNIIWQNFKYLFRGLF